MKIKLIFAGWKISIALGVMLFCLGCFRLFSSGYSEGAALLIASIALLSLGIEEKKSDDLKGNIAAQHYQYRQLLKLASGLAEGAVTPDEVTIDHETQSWRYDPKEKPRDPGENNQA